MIAGRLVRSLPPTNAAPVNHIRGLQPRCIVRPKLYPLSFPLLVANMIASLKQRIKSPRRLTIVDSQESAHTQHHDRAAEEVSAAHKIAPQDLQMIFDPSRRRCGPRVG